MDVRRGQALRDRIKDKSLIKEAAYIAGKWVKPGPEVIEVTNPADGATIAVVPRFGRQETREAIAAAEKARPGWAAKTAKERAAILRKWFDLIIANQDDLALIMTAEQGKPLAEARGEIDYAASFVEFFAEEAKRIYGETIPSPPNAPHRRDQAADRRRRRDHAVEFPDRDDHPQGRPGAGRRLHGGVQAGRGDAAVGAGAGRARRARRHSRRRASTSSPAAPARSATS